MLRTLGELEFVRVTEGWRLKQISRAAILLEHGVVNHVSQIKCLPINRHQLRPGSPIPVWLIIRRIEPQSLRIYPHDMRLIMLD